MSISVNRRQTMGCILLGFFAALSCAQAAPLRVMTHELPPYSLKTSNGEAVGIAARPVRCALNTVGLDFTIAFVPWKRAQAMVQNGEADAFFAASRTAERDSYATLSATIAPQEWRWYLLRDNASDPASPDFKKRNSVASFVGANMLDWLKDNGYQVKGTPTTNPQLLKMLLAKRIDAILANHLVMDALLDEFGVTQQVRSVLLLDKPLGVYFSHAFLSGQPDGFMGRFNAALTGCLNAR